MEEAEALCQRIGILAKGTLRCLESPIRFKQLYGKGFRLHMNTIESHTHKARTFVESILPTGYKKLDQFATNTTYEFPEQVGIVSKLFTVMESGKQEVGILDWGMGQTTLEEVFLKLISESDASHDP